MASSSRTPRSATAPVDAIFKAVERVTGIAANLKEFGGPRRHRRQGRPGRGLPRTRSDDRRPLVPGPGGLDRHHRSLRRGVHQRHQRHRQPTRAGPAPRGHREARGGGVMEPLGPASSIARRKQRRISEAPTRLGSIVRTNQSGWPVRKWAWRSTSRP